MVIVKDFLLGLILVLVVSGVVALDSVGCSAGSSDTSFGTDAEATAPSASSGASEGGGTGVGTEAGACTNPTVSIIFSPMYSAFVPNSTAQVFSIPAVMSDGNMADWTLSDPTQGKLIPGMFDMGGNSVAGVLITIEGTGDAMGQVRVIATEGNGTCGTSVLSITKNTEDDWSIGNARYNDGVALHLGPPPGFDGGAPPMFFRPDGGFDGGLPGFEGGVPFRSDGGSFFETDGGTACTNCHGPTATNGPFNDVSHTPEQTGGFSDSDLKNIILNGQIPDGGYFDPTVIIPSCDGGACATQAYQVWHSFHQWTDISSDQLPGVICYLRSLTPASQNGTSNFGGLRRRDGGPFGPPGPGGPGISPADAGGE